MVNTRRMESVGSTPDNGTRHRTRSRTEVEERESSSDLESEESAQETTNWNNRGSSLRNRRVTRQNHASNLRNKLVYDDIKFNAHVHSKQSSNCDHISLRKRRSLTVYSRKMHNDLYDDNDSEDEIFPTRSRKSRHCRVVHLARIEQRMQRRSALSLRPISQKSYADPHSPSIYNSDSEGNNVGRGKKKRKVQFESWLGDDQMHKVGYPTLHTGYSEEDSRDAQDMVEDSRNGLEDSCRRSTRHRSSINNRIQNSNYIYHYDTEDIQPTRRRRRRRVVGVENRTITSDISNRELRSRRESNDKENKNKSNNVNVRSNGQFIKKDLKGDDDDDDVENGNSEENAKTVQQNGENEEEKDKEDDASTPPEDSKDNTNNKDQDSSESDVPRLRTRTRANKRIIRRTTFDRSLVLNQKGSKSSSSEDDMTNGKKYSLRSRPPKPPPNIVREHELSTHSRRRRFTRRRKSSTSSSSSDSDVHHKDKYNKNAKNQHSKNEKMKSGAGASKIIPIGPETIDTKVRFSSIGGLDSHIQCLKEMILLPMMYPEVFRQFQIQPPKGVLFHGPPGTGKTLIARALANECSFGSKKVSFFLRKGADLLSKWIGESEKQLRLLFAQAAEMNPSIIFFDELDGLAPVRSSRQDQFHASIVSTLLALMDGLDNRGNVIVIGATNRIDAIDPALRRPGRFDRELFFPLPSRQEREEILNVHVSQWSQAPSNQLLLYLAENSVGYCGSDLRALCTEAVIQSFRRTYPQVYNSDHRLLLEPKNVSVEKVDFLRAKSLLVPASHRISQSLGRKLLPILEPILAEPLNNVFAVLEQTFPHALNTALAKVKLSANVRPAHLLLVGDGAEHGQTLHLAPAMLFRMEHISSYILDLSTLYKETTRSPEEACIQVFSEAKRNIPSVIYIPSIDKWWSLVSETVKAIFISQLSFLESNIPLLLLATADTTYQNLPEEVQAIFSRYRKEVYQINPPNSDCRKAFFKPLLIEACLKPPRSPRQRPKTPPPLPRAPTPPPSPLTEDQAKKLYEKEEHTLRELRIFLRDMCKKLANNKLFYMFTKPVDTEEVPDYTTIIKQPMDLETMMTKVDFHKYECAKDFLTDIELICHNALEYNPARSSADKQIRHRACSLRDYAYTLIKNEMDTDFEDKCQDIAKKRLTRKVSVSKFLPAYINTPEDNTVTVVSGGDDAPEQKNDQAQNSATRVLPVRKRRVPSWQRGYLKKRRKISNNRIVDASQEDAIKESSDDESKENNPVMEGTDDSKASDSKAEFSSTPVTSNVAIETMTPLKINCDPSPIRKDDPSQLQSPKRRLNDLLSPSDLLEETLDFDDIDQALNENASENDSNKKPVECVQQELEKVLEQAVRITSGYSLQSLLDLYNQLSKIVQKFSRTHIRTTLHKELLKELTRFKKEGDVSEAFTSVSTKMNVDC